MPIQTGLGLSVCASAKFKPPCDALMLSGGPIVLAGARESFPPRFKKASILL